LRLVGGREQLPRQLLQADADAVVFLPDADQFSHPGLERLVALAQYQHLALDQRDGPAAVRMTDAHLGQQVGVLVEEIRVAVKPVGHLHVIQFRHRLLHVLQFCRGFLPRVGRRSDRGFGRKLALRVALPINRLCGGSWKGGLRDWTHVALVGCWYRG
jgi:hypothetical protein